MSLQLNYIFPVGSLVSLYIVALVLISGCTGGHETLSGNGEKIIVACTIPPQEEFIRAVGGDRVNVIVMVPQGASPHSYEPEPSQIRALEDADLYIALGSGIEFENRWLDRIRGMNPDLQIINSSKSLTLLENPEHSHQDGTGYETGDHHEEGETDPHVWLSPANVASMINTTCDALSVRDPTSSAIFGAGRDQYLVELERLDRSIREHLSPLRNRTILVYHPAFGYFCRDYDLVQKSVESEGKEPTGQEIASLIQLAREEGIRVVFTEPGYSPANARTIADAIDGSVIEISPLEKDYLANMKTIAANIVLSS
jgi:zinc transport system substrate-binding protein